MNNQENQAPKTTTETPSWRDTIREAAKNAREYAQAVAEDYIAELNNANEEDRQGETERTADALRHAAAYYEIAAQLEAATKATEDEKAAKDVAWAIDRAGERETVTDWGCPIAATIGRAAREAITEATKGLTGEPGTSEAAATAANLAKAFAEANRWG